ncbi:glycosyltransferase family 4 protein [Micromonospora chokoriensis]
MNVSKEWIAYVGPFLFPWGEAGSRRVNGIAASLAVAGYQVVVASGSPEPRTVTPLAGIDGPGSVSYVGLSERPPPEAGLLSSAAQTLLMWGRQTARWLDAQPTKPTHVLVNGGQAQYMFHLQRWCRRNSVPLIVDVVDWHNGHHVRGGYFGPLHGSMKLALHYQYPRCDGIIVISSFLERHYQRAGKPMVLVPPTLDVKNLTVSPQAAPNDPSTLTLVYAGRPYGNKKDFLGVAIDATAQVEREGARIELRVYGPALDEVRRLVDGRPLPAGLRCLGRIPQSEVANALQQADFSVIIRRPDRAATAGMATKFGESLANGTPVIANLTSDMGRYLHHGREGLISRDHSLAGVTEAIRAATRLSGAQRSLMRQAARSRALESFDYRVHTEALGKFLRNWS